MNNGFESGSSSQIVTNFPAAWKLALAGLLALVSVTLVILQVFQFSNGPLVVLASELGFSGAAHRFPKGQLQADAKTLVTTLQWLVTPQPDVPCPTVLPASPSPTNQPLNSRQISALTGFPVGLHQVENIPFGTLVIRQPAASGAWHLEDAPFPGFIVSPACGEDAASRRRI